MTASIGALDTCARLLREPVSLGRGDPRVSLEKYGPLLLAVAVVSAAVFGGVVGTYRGGVQLVFAAVKLPLLWLIPILVTLPAVRALHRVCGVDVDYGQVALAALVGTARAALVLAVASPALWLLYSLHVGYHVAVLALCGSLVAAGGVGLHTTARILPGSGAGKAVANMLAVAAVGVVFAQSGWVLRPFIARPRAEVSFMRTVESDVFSSVAASWRSARGDYTGWDARRQGLLANPEADSP
ncbi:MAG: hypothetical protein JKY37_20865 [Nannocystaceae bacterium]|nr:hypothetical protein [Nannocystaceae bacterium]